MGKNRKTTMSGLEQKLAQALTDNDPTGITMAARENLPAGMAFDEQFARAREVLGQGPDPRAIVVLAPLFQLAFLHLLCKDEDADGLNDVLSMTTDKEVKKEAKRQIHQLKSRGLDVSVATGARESILDRPLQASDPELTCQLGPVSARGSRMLLLARYVQGGVGIYQAELSDTTGLVEFNGGTMGRSRYRQLLGAMEQEAGESLLPVTYVEARKRLSQAAALSREKSLALPDEYLEASSQLPEDAAGFELSKGSEQYPLDSLDLAEVAAAASLHDLPEFTDWVPQEEVLQSLHTRFQEIESSKVAINRDQKIEQVQAALAQAAEQCVGVEKARLRIQERLFEMALYLARTKKLEQARLAASVAWQLADESFAVGESPFFLRLVTKLFRTPEDIVERMESPAKELSADPKAGPPSSILTP